MFRTRYCFAHSNSFHPMTEKPLLLLLLNTHYHFQSIPLESSCGMHLGALPYDGKVNERDATCLATGYSVSDIALNKFPRSSDQCLKSLENIHSTQSGELSVEPWPSSPIKLKRPFREISGSQVACTSASLA